MKKKKCTCRSGRHCDRVDLPYGGRIKSTRQAMTTQINVRAGPPYLASGGMGRLDSKLDTTELLPTDGPDAEPLEYDDPVSEMADELTVDDAIVASPHRCQVQRSGLTPAAPAQHQKKKKKKKKKDKKIDRKT